MIKEGQLIFDAQFGINLQQFIFQNYDIQNILYKVKQHLQYKINKYISQIKAIQLLVDVNRCNMNENIMFFVLSYTVNKDNTSIQFILNDGNVILNV